MPQETPDQPKLPDVPATGTDATSTVEADLVPVGSEMDDEQRANATGPQVIAGYLKTLPSGPGVYRMLNSDGDVIYVGKARSLKARVSNYARLGGHTNRIARMISATAAMEFVTVRTEAEALLLEANLIKRFRPRFNVLMRDDKSFPYIRVTRSRCPAHPEASRRAQPARTTTSGRSLPPARSIARSTCCSARSCCAPAPTASTTAAPAPACSFRSSAAPGPVPARSAKQDYAAQVDEAKSAFSRAKARVRAQKCTNASWRRLPKRSSTSGLPRSIATGSGHWRM